MEITSAIGPRNSLFSTYEIVSELAVSVGIAEADTSFALHFRPDGEIGRRSGLEVCLSAHRETGGVELLKVGEPCKGNPEPSLEALPGRCRD